MAGIKHCFGERRGRIVSEIQRQAWGALWDYSKQVRCVILCDSNYQSVFENKQESPYPFLMSQMRDICDSKTILFKRLICCSTNVGLWTVSAHHQNKSSHSFVLDCMFHVYIQTFEKLGQETLRFQGIYFSFICILSQVFLSTRRGAWIWNRVWDNGMPVDTVLFTRFNAVLTRFYPTFLINRWAENKLNARFNHDVYGLLPQHRYVLGFLQSNFVSAFKPWYS